MVILNHLRVWRLGITFDCDKAVHGVREKLRRHLNMGRSELKDFFISRKGHKGTGII